MRGSLAQDLSDEYSPILTPRSHSAISQGVRVQGYRVLRVLRSVV